MNTGSRRYHRMRLLSNSRSERQSLEPLAPVAERLGYEVEFADKPPADGETVEIAIYAGHARDPDMPRVEPTAAAFSVVVLHDVGQNTWPDEATEEDNLWLKEPWDVFDVGILPGPAWTQAWRKAARVPGAYPRLGMFELGYPKADPAFNGDPRFQHEVNELHEKLGIRDRPTILLAASWDSDDNDRFHDFSRSLDDLDVNLIVKYPPGDEPIVRRLKEEYANEHGTLAFADSKTNIMACLALSDIIISDESSCVGEATLFEIPGICITDWNVPALPPPWNRPERPSRATSFTQNVPSERMRETVEATLADLEAHRQVARRVRDANFINLGDSAEKIIELVDYLSGVPHPPAFQRR